MSGKDGVEDRGERSVGLHYHIGLLKMTPSVWKCDLIVCTLHVTRIT